VFTEMNHVFWLNEDETLTFDLLTKIFKLGHSRIPIFREINKVNYCIGLLYVKDLILVDPDDNVPITKILQAFDHHHSPIDVWKYDDLQKTLQAFINKRQHLAFVKDKKGHKPGNIMTKRDNDGAWYCGVITLEDVIEEILKKELVDEYDNYVSNDNLKSTTPRLKEINWSNSLLNRNTEDNKLSLSKKHLHHPQMMPFPVKIIGNDAEKVIPSGPPTLIRKSDSFKLLGLNQLNKKENEESNEEFQYLQINYKSISIQIRCLKETVVETVDGLHHGQMQKQLRMDGQKVMEITDLYI